MTIMLNQVRSSTHSLRWLKHLTVISRIEFRRHKEVDNPAYLIGFLSQWKFYLDQIPAGPEAQQFKGRKMDPTVFEKVSWGIFFVWRLTWANILTRPVVVRAARTDV